MLDARPRLFFDYVDPGSYLMDLRVERAAAGVGQPVERVPFELRPPPGELVAPDDPAWLAYWSDMAEPLRDEGVPVRRPDLVPWTRKAHELVLHAHEKGDGGDLHRTLFRQYLEEGVDIGRVDVLLQLATRAGLDATETKAVLDVDRHAEGVEQVRRDALARGVRGVPTLALGERILEGVHDDEVIRAFLREQP